MLCIVNCCAFKIFYTFISLNSQNVLPICLFDLVFKWSCAVTFFFK